MRWKLQTIALGHIGNHIILQLGATWARPSPPTIVIFAFIMPWDTKSNQFPQNHAKAEYICRLAICLHNSTSLEY